MLLIKPFEGIKMNDEEIIGRNLGKLQHTLAKIDAEDAMKPIKHFQRLLENTLDEFEKNGDDGECGFGWLVQALFHSTTVEEMPDPPQLLSDFINSEVKRFKTAIEVLAYFDSGQEEGPAMEEAVKHCVGAANELAVRVEFGTLKGATGFDIVPPISDEEVPDASV